MKIPESVKIGPYAYPITRPQRVEVDNRLCWGHISFNPPRIDIQEEVSPERAFVSFLHESIHGIDDAWSIGLTEKQVERLGVGLAAFLTDNDILKGG